MQIVQGLVIQFCYHSSHFIFIFFFNFPPLSASSGNLMKNTRGRNAQEGLWREIIRSLHSCVLAWPLIDRASKMLTDSLAAGHSSLRFIPVPRKSEEGEGRAGEDWKCCCGWSDYKKNFFFNAKTSSITKALSPGEVFHHPVPHPFASERCKMYLEEQRVRFNR